MDETTLEFFVGPGGWLQTTVRRSREDVMFVFVRFWRDGDGKWRSEGTIYFPGLTPESLHRIPLRRILLAVAASASLRDRLSARLGEQVPEVGTVEFVKAFDGFLVPEPIKLERPAGRNLPDSFYATVGEAYRAAVANGLRPRITIAEAAGVSNEVAGRWVRQARKRGYLPATEPGKVSA